MTEPMCEARKMALRQCQGVSLVLLILLFMALARA